MTTLPSPLIPLPSTHKSSQKPIAQPQPIHSRSNPLDETDINRFATLFTPATPPATPTPIFRDQHPTTTRPQHHRNRTVSAESEFGAFVSVPAAQDPLSFDFPVVEQSAQKQQGSAPSGNTSLDYFDQFTASAKTASEQSRRGVLDELLEHEDDPLYFLQAHGYPPLPPTSQIPLASPPASVVTSSPPPIPEHSNLIDADIKPPSPPPSKLPIRTSSIPPQSPVIARTPLPPRLSGAASPPSAHSLPTSSSSLPFPSSPSTPPAHATLSRLSSSWVSSLLPSGRSRQSTAPSSSSSTIVHSAAAPLSQTSLPSRIHIAHPTPGITRGTPFASHPYIPPTGAPGFAGDHSWDKGFSDTLEDEEMREVRGMLGKANKGKGKKGKTVNLIGRREGTVGVLNEDIANLVRFCPVHCTVLYLRLTLALC
jgi:hypothetical protein